MRKLLLGLSVILSVIFSLEAAAIACSCVAPETPEASRATARQLVQNAVAVVEVDVLSEHRPGGPGELVSLRLTLFGTAPKTFRIQRGPYASEASCDLLLRKGQRKVLILSKPTGNRTIGQRFHMQSLCFDYLTSDRGYLAVTLQEARGRRRSASASVAKSVPNGRYQEFPGFDHAIPPEPVAPVLGSRLSRKQMFRAGIPSSQFVGVCFPMKATRSRQSVYHPR